MDLIDHYARTVRVFLPKEQREDIIRELLDDIRSQAADKEAELGGRPLSDAEQASLLQQYGHPMLIASRYRPQRHLIGPLVFPYYWLALKVTLALVVGGHVISAAVMLAGGVQPAEIGVAGETLIRHVLAVLGWFTVLAAFFDRWLTQSKVLEKWNPSDLHRAMDGRWAAVEAMGQTGALVQHALDHAGPRFRVTSIPQFVACVVFSAWWILSLKFPLLILGSGARMLDWAPLVDRLFPYMVAFQLLMLADQFVRLTRPHYLRFLRFTRIVWANASWVFIVLLLLPDHRWVVWTGSAEQWERFKALVTIAGRPLSIVDVVNYSISLALVIVAIGIVIDTLRGSHRFSRRRATAHVSIA